MTPSVHVIATTFEGTRAALATAVPLARGFGARLVVLVPRIVSCAEELALPTESTELLAKCYTNVLHDTGADADVQMLSSIGLDDLVSTVCGVGSFVVLGGPTGRWLTSPEERFANRLARLGCSVVFVPSGTNTTQRRIAA